MSSTDTSLSPDLADAARGGQEPKSLAQAITALRRLLDGVAQTFAALTSDTDRPAVGDTTPQRLDAAGDLLDGVAQPAPARLVRAMAAAQLRLAQSPQQCTPEAASTLESARTALLAHLEAELAGGASAGSAVALFPVYRATQALAGNDKAHPADLWTAPVVAHPLAQAPWPPAAPPLAYGPPARALLDAGVLGMVKTADVAAAAQLRGLALGFAAAQTQPPLAMFWQTAAGFFEAFALGLLAPDVYTKRMASRVLLQYAALARGEDALSDRLTHDLLFYCAQAQPDGLPAAGAPVLRAVRAAHGLAQPARVDCAALPPTPDEPVKRIGNLRIPLALYNQYLNEADDWSACLEVALQEWALAPHQPLPAQAVGWADALAQSSARVGFEALARLSRRLAQALAHVQPQGAGLAPQLAVFESAAQEIRRLLHQFAAGFIKAPQAGVDTALQQLLATPVQAVTVPAPAAAVSDQGLAKRIAGVAEAQQARSRIEAHLVQARSALYDLQALIERLRGQLGVPVEAGVATDLAASVEDVARIQRSLQQGLFAAEDDLMAQGLQLRALQRDLQALRPGGE